VVRVDTYSLPALAACAWRRLPWHAVDLVALCPLHCRTDISHPPGSASLRHPAPTPELYTPRVLIESGQVGRESAVWGAQPARTASRGPTDTRFKSPLETDDGLLCFPRSRFLIPTLW
jgi:hypothetical protein